MSNWDRFHFLKGMLLALLVLAACQPIHPQSAVSIIAQPVSDQELGAQLDRLLTQLNQEGTFNGAVLIARNGQVLLRKGYGLADREQQTPNTPTTRFRLASLTKQFTALSILMLQEQGKLKVEDRVCQYIQDCPASWQTMTIHHLLTHTSGVYDFRDFTYTGETPPAPSTSAQVIQRIKEQPLKFAPGEDFSYTNGGFMVAGYIVEQVSGQSYEQFVQEHIFKPVGMQNTGYAHDARSLAVGYRNATTQENPLDGSLPFAAAGLYSTVDDLYLYLQALESGKLVSQQSLEALFGRQVLMGADNGGFSPGYEPPSYYAYGWAVATFKGHRVIGHDGWIEGYGGDVRRYPDDHVTTILLMNLSEPYAASIGDQIAQTIFGTELPAAASVDDKLANAMSAAPLAIAKDATVLDWPSEEGGEMIVLREGTNGWTCFPDWLPSPGNDPVCNDATWTAWNEAVAKGEEPKVNAPGVAYMLQGGSDPSHTDPTASRPAPGEDWINTPPHIMILAPGGFDAADFATEAKQDEPWIMFDGTPYEHLMVPVVPIAKEAMGEMEADVQNTLSSAPAGIALHATILRDPEKEGDPMAVAKEGTNSWTCWPDRPVSPGNDPDCNNAQMDQAFSAGMDAVVSKPGIGYMLQGGSDESNVDPIATGPAPGEDWITTPPHVMLMVPGGFDADQFTTDHNSGLPYIMWDGTPVEHLMIPIADMPQTK